MEEYLKISKISPFISTGNLGDYIISDYCNRTLYEMFGDYMEVVVPSREPVSSPGRIAMLTSQYTFVCGTNLLSSNMRTYRAWNINNSTKLKIALSNVSKKKLLDFDLIKKNLDSIHIILLGVGWMDYQDKPTGYTKKLLTGILDTNYIHSVRDSYTEAKLNEIGIRNVVNTACPTMWGLTKELCTHIPKKKADTVVTTITDYRKDTTRDKQLLDLLLTTYSSVCVWLQSFEDINYLNSLGFMDRVQTIPPTLKCYDDFLEESSVDYIGTRLHGGIRALNHRKRSCIIGIDNRAIEISKDTKLPVINACDIGKELPDWIRNEYETDIILPQENINTWKSQFC